MGAFTRAMVPVVTLGVGTWLGLGRPDVRTAFAASTRAVTSVTAAARKLPIESPLVPPLDRPPPSTDAGELPEPPSIFRTLNPDDTVERAWLLSEGPVHTPRDGHRLVTFTFDDGPFPETAPTVLRILAEHRIRATFFLIGKYLEGDDKRAVETRSWARHIADAGHYVGDHTRDHKQLPSLTHSAALAEIEDSAADIEKATGKRPVLFRPPYGELDPWLEGVLRDKKLDLVLWNIDVEDMKKSEPDEIVNGLEQQLDDKKGGIVLLHDMHWPSVKAFNRLLRWLELNPWNPAHPDRIGWDIVDLPTYMRATAAAPQPYASRDDLERARQGLPTRLPRRDTASQP